MCHQETIGFASYNGFGAEMKNVRDAFIVKMPLFLDFSCIINSILAAEVSNLCIPYVFQEKDVCFSVKLISLHGLHNGTRGYRRQCPFSSVGSLQYGAYYLIYHLYCTGAVLEFLK